MEEIIGVEEQKTFILSKIREYLLREDVTSEQKNQLILDIAVTLSSPTSGRFSGVFVLPEGVGTVRGAHRRAFSFFVERRWLLRVQRKTENGNLYEYWAMYRRKAGGGDTQQCVSIGKVSEWTPTQEFLDEFNAKWAGDNGRPSRTAVIGLLAKHNYQSGELD